MIGSFSVSPRNVRRTVVRAMESASSDRWHDGEVVAVLERGLQPRPEANVLVVPVDVDELAELSLVVIEALLEAREFLIQFVQRSARVTGMALDNGRAASQLSQATGDANFDRHVVVIISSARPVPSPARGGGPGGGLRLRRPNDLVGLAALRHQIVDGADDDDHDNHELEGRNRVPEPAEACTAGREHAIKARVTGRTGPEEVDEHR